MTKQQELSELSKLINDSEIYEVLELLDAKLKTYQYTTEVAKFRYCIQLEFVALNKNLTLLKNRLEHVKKLSATWETLE